MELTDFQILFGISILLFFTINNIVLYGIFGSYIYAIILSFVGTNLLMFNILYATQQIEEYMVIVKGYATDVYDTLVYDPSTDTAGDYTTNLIAAIWNIYIKSMNIVIDNIAPLFALPFYFTFTIGYQMLAYTVISPLRILQTVLKWVEDTIKPTTITPPNEDE